MSTAAADSVVLVAGGTGGLGRAVTEALLAAGARVTVTYRSSAEFDALVHSVRAAERLQGRSVDVTDEPAVRQLVAELLARHGRVDALVNTVGGYAGGQPLWSAEPGTLERMLQLNLRSTYVLARAVVPAMLQQAHGCIVAVAAKAAVEPPAGAAEYAAAKAAALALMASLAAELKGSGVRVNSILPSIIDTPANRAAMPAAHFAKWPTPAQIAAVVRFLCSADASVIHGAAIPVYGNG